MDSHWIFILLHCVLASQKINIFHLLFLLYGIGTFVTGKIINFKPLSIGGICLFFTYLLHYIYKDENQLLICICVACILYHSRFFIKKRIQQTAKASLMKPFTDLDPILHSQLRLAIMSLLVSVKEAEFSYLQEATNSTNGNLSVQISKLKEAEYIDVKKSFEKNYPKTTCKITKKGMKAFEKYVSDIKQYLTPKN
jgi:DNA-binding HxlR family transcriptional regulator